MIRIDEIYNNTFWPWFQNNLPPTRLFYCFPPGRSDVHSLQNYGIGGTEQHYIFFHDQEPIHLDIHLSLFDSVMSRSEDITSQWPDSSRIFITSEHESEYTDYLSIVHNWKHFYYFYHGWAALDWYRGYNKAFLIAPPSERTIVNSFICPNRIIGGKRKHRVLLMHHLLTKNIKNALISFPKVCPAENIPIEMIVNELETDYPGIKTTIERANFPWHFQSDIESNTEHPMHSCILSLFNECATSLVFVVTETVQAGRRHHLTEKTFKPICLGMPFIIVSTAGSLQYLRSYGFKTFGDIWDESYDTEPDDAKRLEKIADLLAYIDSLSVRQLQELHAQVAPIVQHNFDHFYRGGFEQILWDEFTNMLDQIKLHMQSTRL